MSRYIKNNNQTLLIMLAVGVMLSVIACTKGGSLDGLRGDVYAISGNATGAQVVPASNATGNANFTGLFDAGANSLVYTIKWTALWTAPVKDTITKANFYSAAAAGQTGDSAKSIFILSGKMLNASDSITNSLSGVLGLSDKQREDLIAGKWYYTIFTKKYPNGIVRAQLSADKKY
jgi:hypothetical protein